MRKIPILIGAAQQVLLLGILLSLVLYFCFDNSHQPSATSKVARAFNASSNNTYASYDQSSPSLNDSFPFQIRVKEKDDYSCSAEDPCSNGACCGVDGFCGYGERL